MTCVWDAGAVLGEGPVWDGTTGALWWVDIKKPALHRFRPADGAAESWPMPEFIGAVAVRRAGGLIAACRSGFKLVDPEAGRFAAIGDPEPGLPGNRFNDGACDGAGRFWAGSMDNDERAPSGALYRLDPDRRWHRMDDGYVVTNGPAFSPDGRTLYHNDTARGRVYAFDLAADGSLANRRVHLSIPEADGYPDGMAVDAGGFLWLAHWGGWRISRFAPDGRLDRVIRLPVAQVTKCAFGGPALDTLYITSAAIGLDAGQRAAQPLAGGLFAAVPGVRGLPAGTYAG